MNWKNNPNVKFTHISYDGKSPTNAAWDSYVENGRKPLQWVADKFGKNKCWKVIKAKWDLEKKALKFTVLVNAESSEDIDVSYEDICKEMSWKSFDLIGNTSCVPVPITSEEVAMRYKKAVASTKEKDKKWLEEHPDDPTKDGASKKANA